jgi:hypothetical protein
MMAARVRQHGTCSPALSFRAYFHSLHRPLPRIDAEMPRVHVMHMDVRMARGA